MPLVPANQALAKAGRASGAAPVERLPGAPCERDRVGRLRTELALGLPLLLIQVLPGPTRCGLQGQTTHQTFGKDVNKQDGGKNNRGNFK